MPIADDLFYKWHQRKNDRKKLESENHRIEEPKPVRPVITSKPLVRGYDSRDLFWEDALIRIREIRRQIAADLKKEE
jgi:hypothetical protein